MLTLTRKADYALVAMAALARSVPERLSARKLAELVHVPLPVLTNILHQLVLRGLVHSTRGAQGGYRLAKGSEDITLFEMIEAVEGPLKLTLCCCDGEDPDEGQSRCDLELDCHIKEPVRRVHAGLRRFLTQVALSQIACDTAPVRLGVVGRTRLDDRCRSESVETARAARGAERAST